MLKITPETKPPTRENAVRIRYRADVVVFYRVAGIQLDGVRVYSRYAPGGFNVA